MDLFIQYAVGAAGQAMRQSGPKVNEEDNADGVGCWWESGSAG
jgi:hypothetical protein